MTAVTTPTTRRQVRAIGPLGTAARVVLGAAMFGSVVVGHATRGWRPMPWLIALIVFPGLLIAWQRFRLRRNAARLQATGPLWHVLNVAVFFALYLTPEFVPALEPLSDATLIFYGVSMLLAAVRGYAGCEVLAVSNWVLGRDDQVGCLVFGPVDAVERSMKRTEPTA